ncbi:TatD family hydrolase [Salinispira pacifica]
MSKETAVELPVVEQFVDSHCHLHIIAAKGADAGALLKSAFDRGAAWIMDVGVDLDTVEARERITSQFPRVLETQGLYPSQAERPDIESLVDRLESLCALKRPAAIGEIGLDFYRDYADRSRQRELFRRQLTLAGKQSLPVVIHNRDADEETIEELRAAALERTGVMHCFAGDIAFARRCLDAGYYISFAGNVTFKKAAGLREVAAFVPSDRLLLETDAPYLAPVPMRGRTNHPLLVNHTYAAVAEVRKVPADQLAADIVVNFERLFLEERG